MPNATIEPVGDADPGTIDPSLSDPFATATATLIPPLAAASSASVEATLDDADDAPAESPSAPDSPSAAPLTPTAPGPDANITTTGLLPQHAPTDTAGAPPSPQSVPQSAHAAPDPPGWTEARGTVAFTLSDAVKDGVQNVSIDLHPAELGHVGIQLSFHASGVSVQMTLSRQDTYEAFSRDRAALEQQLAQTGIHLGNGGLDLRFDQKRDQPPAFSESAFTTRIRPVQPDTAVQPPAGPRAAHGLLNIIA
jgi:flagellar hook-length control protein FliK